MVHVVAPIHDETLCTCTYVNIPFVKASDSLGHLSVGGWRGCFPLLGYLVQGIHIRLMSGHFLLESLKIRNKQQEGKERSEGETIEGRREGYKNCMKAQYGVCWYASTNMLTDLMCSELVFHSDQFISNWSGLGVCHGSLCPSHPLP